MSAEKAQARSATLPRAMAVALALGLTVGGLWPWSQLGSATSAPTRSDTLNVVDVSGEPVDPATLFVQPPTFLADGVAYHLGFVHTPSREEDRNVIVRWAIGSERLEVATVPRASAPAADETIMLRRADGALVVVMDGAIFTLDGGGPLDEVSITAWSTTARGGLGTLGVGVSGGAIEYVELPVNDGEHDGAVRISTLTAAGAPAITRFLAAPAEPFEHASAWASVSVSARRDADGWHVLRVAWPRDAQWGAPVELALYEHTEDGATEHVGAVTTQRSDFAGDAPLLEAPTWLLREAFVDGAGSHVPSTTARARFVRLPHAWETVRASDHGAASVGLGIVDLATGRAYGAEHYPERFAYGERWLRVEGNDDELSLCPEEGACGGRLRARPSDVSFVPDADGSWWAIGIAWLGAQTPGEPLRFHLDPSFEPIGAREGRERATELVTLAGARGEPAHGALTVGMLSLPLVGLVLALVALVFGRARPASRSP